MQIAFNHSNRLICERPYLFRGSIRRENTVTNRNNRVNFRCQNMSDLILDSQPCEVDYIFWVSSGLS